MLKQILIALGLRDAPRPVRAHVAASSLVGGVPALGIRKRRRDGGTDASAPNPGPAPAAVDPSAGAI